MPIGFPSNTSVTDVDNIHRLPNDVPPLAEAIRTLDSLTQDKSATDFGIKYKYCVKEDEKGNFLYGDVNTARCRVRDAYNRCLIEKHDVSEYRTDVPLHEQYKANVQQVEGYLEYAIDFLDRALDRIDNSVDDDDCAKFVTTVQSAKDVIQQHRTAAQNGYVYAGPPADSIL